MRETPAVGIDGDLFIARFWSWGLTTNPAFSLIDSSEVVERGTRWDLGRPVPQGSEGIEPTISMVGGPSEAVVLGIGITSDCVIPWLQVWELRIRDCHGRWPRSCPHLSQSWTMAERRP